MTIPPPPLPPPPLPEAQLPINSSSNDAILNYSAQQGVAPLLPVPGLPLTTAVPLPPGSFPPHHFQPPGLNPNLILNSTGFYDSQIVVPPLSIAPLSHVPLLPGQLPPVPVQSGQFPPRLLQHQHIQHMNPTTVILTHVPQFLCQSRNLRDLIHPCGSCRSVIISYGNRPYDTNSSTQKTKDPIEQNLTVAVVKMAHSSGAFYLCRNWEAACRNLNQDSFKKDSNKKISNKEKVVMKAFLLASNSEHSPLRPCTNEYDASCMESMYEGLWGNNYENGIIISSIDDEMVVKLTEAFTAIRMRQASLDSNNGAESISDFGKDLIPSSSIASSEVIATEIVEEEKELEGVTQTAIKLDVSKVAAAAGGGAYDEDVDPLNAPVVLQAVARFKIKLEERDATNKKKRMEFINARLKGEVAKSKLKLKEKKIEEEKEKEIEAKRKLFEITEESKHVLQEGLPPLPPPPLPPTSKDPPLPPMPSSVVEDGVKDTGRRGVSNLPSWMTKSVAKTDTVDKDAISLNPNATEDTSSLKRKLVPSEANRDINQRRQRIDTGDDSMSLAQIRAANEAADAAERDLSAKKDVSKPSSTIYFGTTVTKEQLFSPDAAFPPLIPKYIENIRIYVTEQIVEYLGEAEKTLIDFVMNHLTQSTKEQPRKTKVLLEELGAVLEEDAETFVLDLYKKVSSYQ